MTKHQVLHTWSSLAACLSERARNNSRQGKCRSLERRLARLSERSSGQTFNFDFLNPFSSKNPILIPQSPKLIYRNVFRSYTQHNSINNSENTINNTIQLIRQFIIFLRNLKQYNNFQSKFMKHAYIYYNWNANPPLPQFSEFYSKNRWTLSS